MSKAILFISASILAACSSTGGGLSALSTEDIAPASGLPYCAALGVEIPSDADVVSGQTVRLLEEPEEQRRGPRRRASTGSRIPSRGDSVRPYPTRIGGDFDGSTSSGRVMDGLMLSGERYDDIRDYIERNSGIQLTGEEIRCVIR